MITLVGGIKGGSGKTTVATNLAIMRAAEGHDVLLIDADEQESSADFTQLRNEKLGNAGYTSINLAGTAVRNQTLRLAEKYDDIIIDTGGRDTTSQRAGLSIANVMLVPFVPRSFDVWTLERVAALVDEMRTANPDLKAHTFLNRADSRGQDNAGASQMLKENAALKFSDIAIGNRKAFGNAAAAGLAVTELKPQDLKAVEEVLILYRYVFDIKPESSRNQCDTTPDTAAKGEHNGNYI